MCTFTSISWLLNRNNHNIHILAGKIYASSKQLQILREGLPLTLRYHIMPWDFSKLKSKLPAAISQELQSLNANVSNKSPIRNVPSLYLCSRSVNGVVSNDTDITSYLEIGNTSSKKRKLPNTPDTSDLKVAKMDIENGFMCELPFSDSKTIDNRNSNNGDNSLKLKVVCNPPTTVCIAPKEQVRKTRNSRLELCGNEKSDLVKSIKEVHNISRKDKKRDANRKHGSKESKSRPTHFLAFRLKNPHIHEKAAHVHESMLKMNKDFKPAFVPLPTLHVTLAVMTLNNKEDITNANKALAMSLNRLKDIYDKTVCKSVEFDSLETFNGKVLFIDVRENEGSRLLRLMAPLLKEALLSNNVDVTKEVFKPHATIMKLSRNYNKLKKKGIKRIPEELYKEQKIEYFGSEELTEILLCSMSDKKTDDGFYKIVGTLDLMNSKWIGDAEECNNTHNLQRIMGKSIPGNMQSQPKRSYHAVTVFPEMEVSDLNHAEFLYGNIFIELCVNVYRIFVQYLRKLFNYE